MTKRRLVKPSASSLRMTTAHPGPRRRSQSGSTRLAVAGASCAVSTPVICVLLCLGLEPPVDIVEREVRIARSLGELADRALRDEPAVGEDPDAIAEPLDLGQQVAREQHRQPAVADEGADEVQQLG